MIEATSLHDQMVKLAQRIAKSVLPSSWLDNGGSSGGFHEGAIDESKKVAYRAEIPASDILANIESGEPVILDGVIINGDLDVSSLNLNTQHVCRKFITQDQEAKQALLKHSKLSETLKEVSSEVKITNSMIKGVVNFRNCIFFKSLYLNNTEFKDCVKMEGCFFFDSNFSFSRFNKSANFCSSEFDKTNFRNAKFKANADFYNIKLNGLNADFGMSTFFDDVSFDASASDCTLDMRYAKFFNNVYFNEGKFEGAIFFGSKVRGRAKFDKMNINRFANFGDMVFYDDASFLGLTINGTADFSGTRFEKNADFGKSKFNGDIDFSGIGLIGPILGSMNINCKRMVFNGLANFFASEFKNANFSGSEFNQKAEFDEAIIRYKIKFNSCLFKDAESQERACRAARISAESFGDRDEADSHFYQEMEGKRRQKFCIDRFLEYIFIQLIFGYGVHPFRLMFCWFLVAAIFAILYWSNDGIPRKLPDNILPKQLIYFIECFYFSIVTAATPGYGTYTLTSWIYQFIASIEAILGTFMWAAFIATFAKKFMR